MYLGIMGGFWGQNESGRLFNYNNSQKIILRIKSIL